MTPEEIRKQRIARGWTQTRLAKELDITKQTVLNWERAHGPVTRMAALALERVFDTSKQCQCRPAQMLDKIRKMVAE